MAQPESWENVCCRCGSDVKENAHPGRRACHITCGPCLYPDNPKCASCEVVGHCRLALDYFKSVSNMEKGHYFNEQLTGEETLYHTLNFTDGQQNMVNELGEKRYLRKLKKAGVSGPTAPAGFVPGLPRDPDVAWRRITLVDPISREWVVAISLVLGVATRIEDSLHVAVRGEQKAVRKAVEMIYQLQMVNKPTKEQQKLFKTKQ